MLVGPADTLPLAPNPDDVEFAAPPALSDAVAALEVAGNFMFDAATHRDFLGAVLGTGIDRSKVNDVGTAMRVLYRSLLCQLVASSADKVVDCSASQLLIDARLPGCVAYLQEFITSGIILLLGNQVMQLSSRQYRVQHADVSAADCAGGRHPGAG